MDFTPGVRRRRRMYLPWLEPGEIVKYVKWFDPMTLSGNTFDCSVDHMIKGYELHS